MFKETEIPEYHFEKVEKTLGLDLINIFCIL